MVAGMKRIVVVDGEAVFCADLVEFLCAKGYDAVGVSTVHQMMDLVEADRFAGLILDVNLPDGDGLSLLSYVRRIYGYDCGVVVLTSHLDRASRISALDAGADAYLVKGATLSEVEATLRSVLRRVPSYECSVDLPSAAGNWRVDCRQWQLIPPAGDAVPLTSTELVFLMILSRHGNNICTRDILLSDLSSYARSNVSNIDAIVRRLRSKIKDATHASPPIRTSYGVGFAFTEPLTVVNYPQS